MLGKTINPLLDTTAFEVAPTSFHVLLGNGLAVVIASDVTGLHEQIDRLSGVSSVFCTVCCTEWDDSIVEDIIVEGNRSSLGENLL